MARHTGKTQETNIDYIYDTKPNLSISDWEARQKAWINFSDELLNNSSSETRPKVEALLIKLTEPYIGGYINFNISENNWFYHKNENGKTLRKSANLQYKGLKSLDSVYENYRNIDHSL